MINHFRTLLVNLPYVSYNDHIPYGFTGLKYPKELQDFYDLLFPKNSSNSYKMFLAYNYLRIIDGAALHDAILKQDTRITYNLDDDITNFKTFRVTNVVGSTNYPITILGKYIGKPDNNSFYDHFYVIQTGVSTVKVYSAMTNSLIIPSVTLTFNGTTRQSQVVQIGNTGLSFYINDPGSSFTSTLNKTWEFVAEAPYAFNFDKLYNDLLRYSDIVNSMLNYKKEAGDINLENMWTQHKNRVYRVAALIISFVYRCDGVNFFVKSPYVVTTSTTTTTTPPGSQWVEIDRACEYVQA